jgi:hypothetical protein
MRNILRIKLRKYYSILCTVNILAHCAAKAKAKAKAKPKPLLRPILGL